MPKRSPPTAAAAKKAAKSSSATQARTPETVRIPPPVAPPTGRVVLGTSCTIHEAQALRAHLLEQAQLAGPYEIDGNGVEQIDTAGVQLVVAFALDCLERGIHYVWKGRSAPLDDAIRVLGVGALLESPGAANYSAGKISA